MKKSLKFIFTALILTIMVYSPNVLATDDVYTGGESVVEPSAQTRCGATPIISDGITLTTENTTLAEKCYEDKVTINLIHNDTPKEVKVKGELLLAIQSKGLTLEITASELDSSSEKESKKELYTTTLTSDEIESLEIESETEYNVTVWVEKLTDENTISTLKGEGYNGVAYLRAAETEAPILNATYEFNADGILENGKYWIIDTEATSNPIEIEVTDNKLEIADTSLFSSYIVENSKVVENTPAPTPTPSTGSSSSTGSNTGSSSSTGSVTITDSGSSNNPSSSTSKDVVEFKQEIVSQSLSIPGKKYEDVIKETIASGENLKEKLVNGANVVIKSEPAPVNESSQNSFKAVVQGGNILNYVDIKINLQADNQDYPITNLKDKIELTLTIPPAPVVPSGYYREYYVLREHDGDIERLDAEVSEDGKTITFSSDKFSIYAVGYVDKEIVSSVVDNPNTGDNIYFIVSAFIISAIGICLSTRKRLTNK